MNINMNWKLKRHLKKRKDQIKKIKTNNKKLRIRKKTDKSKKTKTENTRIWFIPRYK